MVREHAFDPNTDRRLFSIAIAAPSIPVGCLDLPADHFACLLAWDARTASADAVSAFVESLVRAGASYFVCWGPDCERVHDIVDEIVADPNADFGVPEDSCIMTTWHDSEPLRDAVAFFLLHSGPDEHYEDTTRAGLAITVGSISWAAEVEAALDDPAAFVKRWSESGSV